VAVGASGLSKAGAILGQAAGIALVAFAAYELGKSLVDAAMGAKEQLDASREGSTAIAGAVAASGDKAAIRDQLSKLKKQREDMEKEGPGILESLGNAGAWVGNKLGAVSDEDYETATSRRQKSIDATSQTIKDLEEALTRSASGGDKLQRTFDALDKVGGKLARTLGNPNSGGSHGPPPPATRSPGYSGGW
jgi:predicted RNase H-like nuclease (RuvC/YqgF family)